MARMKGRLSKTGRSAGKPAAGADDNGRLKRISKATSQIVKEAAALLDEEVAAGIVAAKKMQQRFERERRIDPADLKDALQRLQQDGHEVINLLDEQFGELRSQENAELITRLVNNSHDLLNLAVGLINIGAEAANQLIQKNLPKQNTRQNERPRRRTRGQSPGRAGEAD